MDRVDWVLARSLDLFFLCGCFFGCRVDISFSFLRVVVVGVEDGWLPIEVGLILRAANFRIGISFMMVFFAG